MNKNINIQNRKKTLKPLKYLNHVFPQLKEFGDVTVNITSIMMHPPSKI